MLWSTNATQVAGVTAWSFFEMCARLRGTHGSGSKNNRPAWLPGPTASTRRASEIPEPSSFLPQVICWFLCHPFFCQPFILLLCLLPVRPASLCSGWCRASNRSIFLHLGPTCFSFCGDLGPFLRPQTGRSGRCFFLQSSSEMLILLFELGTMMALRTAQMI